MVKAAAGAASVYLGCQKVSNLVDTWTILGITLGLNPPLGFMLVLEFDLI
jgi:hypothetical protein